MSEIVKLMLERRAETEQRIVVRAWKDERFRTQLLANPEAVIAKELGLGELPGGIQVKVLEEDAKNLYFVLPQKPRNLEELNIREGLSEEALQMVAGGAAAIPLNAPSQWTNNLSSSFIYIIRNPGLR